MVQPAGYVHPQAIQALSEVGIRHHGESKGVEQFRDKEFALVVTICDDANEQCPVWLGKGRKVHHSFRDPAKAQGTAEQRLAIFRQVRDEIIEAMSALLESEQLPRAAHPRPTAQ